MRLLTIKDEDLDMRVPANLVNESGKMIVFDKTEILPGEELSFDSFSVIVSKDVLSHQFFSQMMGVDSRLVVFCARIPGFVRLLHEKGFNLKNLALVGLRSWSKEEWLFIQQHKIRHFSMKEIVSEGISETCDSAMAFARNSEKFFLSINLEVLDPSFTNLELEPGGLSTRELIYFLQRFRLLQNIASADLIINNKNKPISRIVIKLLAELG